MAPAAWPQAGLAWPLPRGRRPGRAARWLSLKLIRVRLGASASAPGPRPEAGDACRGATLRAGTTWPRQNRQKRPGPGLNQPQPWKAGRCRRRSVNLAAHRCRGRPFAAAAAAAAAFRPGGGAGRARKHSAGAGGVPGLIVAAQPHQRRPAQPGSDGHSPASARDSDLLSHEAGAAGIPAPCLQ